MNNDMYTEVSKKSGIPNDAHSIQYVLDQINEVHSSEYGWSVSSPTIIPSSDGKTVTISVTLRKSNSNIYSGRSK